jgi:hypothetical protein
MRQVKARARIHLIAQDVGGLAGAMPSPSQSLVMHLDASPEEGGGVDLGVRITTATNESLTPGADIDVDLVFWSDLADLYVTIPGKRFELLYPTRVVGHGEVLEVVPF